MLDACGQYYDRTHAPTLITGIDTGLTVYCQPIFIFTRLPRKAMSLHIDLLLFFDYGAAVRWVCGLMVEWAIARVCGHELFELPGRLRGDCGGCAGMRRG